MKTKKAQEKKDEANVIEFYGQECPHCALMKPVVEQVEEELKVKFSKLEVWHSEKNHNVMLKYSEAIEDACGGSLGVPCFYNEKTKKALCGGVDRQTLIDFAKGK